jgi:hypothetical protein
MIPTDKLTGDKISVQHLSRTEAIHRRGKMPPKPQQACARGLPACKKAAILSKL